MTQRGDGIDASLNVELNVDLTEDISSVGDLSDPEKHTVRKRMGRNGSMILFVGFKGLDLLVEGPTYDHPSRNRGRRWVSRH
jgi:hypothetical protein